MLQSHVQRRIGGGRGVLGHNVLKKGERGLGEVFGYMEGFKGGQGA